MQLHAALLARIDRRRQWIAANITAQWERRKGLGGVHHRPHVGGLSRRHDQIGDSWATRRIQDLRQQAANDNATPAVQLAATQANKTNQADMARLIPISMRADPNVGPMLDDFRRSTLDRITSLDDDTIDDLEGVLDEAEMGEWRVEDLADAIEKRLGVSESKAAFLARDSTLKFNAAITKERQTSSGITSYIWSTSGDERVREEHAELDGETFDWDDPPETNDDGDTNAPGEDYQCFPGDSKIQLARGVRKAFRRWYEGELTEIVTGSGKTLRATPNHPVLTVGGWRALKDLHEGDQIVELAQHRLDAPEEDPNVRVPTIRDVFGAAQERGVTKSATLGPAEFHGDVGPHRDVDVVATARPLWIGGDAGPGKRGRQLGLTKPDEPGSALGQALAMVLALLRPAHRIMGRLRPALTKLWRSVAHALAHPLATVALTHASHVQAFGDDDTLDTEAARNRENALAGRVCCNDRGNVEIEEVRRSASALPVGLDPGRPKLGAHGVGVPSEDGGNLLERLPFVHHVARVVQVQRLAFSGHIFNLETNDGWYICNGIVCHNCRCVAVPVIPEDEDEDEDQEDEEGEEDEDEGGGGDQTDIDIAAE